MHLLRSERFPAVVLLIAAALGLFLANSPLAPGVVAVKEAHVGIPGLLDLSVSHWIQDGLLAVFFFVAAIELWHELTEGQLSSLRKAVQPAIAAAGGVITPIIVFALIAMGTSSASGWPIPTATDIAFALGVLAVFGRGLPPGVRAFLLALAILDDIVGIVFIAVLFTDGVDLFLLLAALVGVILFSLLSRRLTDRNRVPLGIVLVLLGILVWVLVYLSGVHATIAGVALGLAMASKPAARVRAGLEPWVNGLVLPLFALSAASVAIPAVGLDELQPVFWGVLIALPVGKLLGITVFGWLSQRLEDPQERLRFADLLAAGALGGIGFTVSLLLSELAFADDAMLRDEATLGVLGGSLVSLVVAAVLVAWRARHYRREERRV
ncbi:NhaA family Na+:H+ antiporter [Microbacterium sp. SORGH_AS428]|uniref:Na+/H+ antiporter NhaA n=1 Tax=Microbacterium sp. SORGH_AS_0428 TaxID=3041788 RepID=UPI00285896D0|nr:Na+/H+ antiporter NhaA [Microbacterium sp. SORGH_AS_0428]MDR6201044.1 NhaA family Na+:H+ antiporter [Microbacterium sp. SORGH_AS_0428]